MKALFFVLLFLCIHSVWSQCDPGEYGPECQYLCSTCELHGTCEEGMAGSCVCDETRTGVYCDECDVGHYGDECQYKCSVCEETNGVCIDGLEGNCTCTGNFDGPQCDECVVGFYGASCNNECTVCELHGTCTEGIEGGCACHDNRDGPTCSVCSPCLYGDNCENACECVNNMKCVAGECVCVFGYTGELCEDRKSFNKANGCDFVTYTLGKQIG